MAPGHVCVPGVPTRLCAVAASGVVVTLFDRQRCRGGMGHFCRPYREAGRSTAAFAAPAIVGLMRMMVAAGTEPEGLEACLFGGAENCDAGGYCPGVARQNVTVAREVLRKLRVPIVGEDTGGVQGRKVVFDSGTGEAVVARVDRVRSSDWYPSPAS